MKVFFKFLNKFFNLTEFVVATEFVGFVQKKKQSFLQTELYMF
jgi:hypothetical protein